MENQVNTQSAQASALTFVSTASNQDQSETKTNQKEEKAMDQVTTATTTEEPVKARRTNARKLATEKNVLGRKNVRLKNRKAKIADYRKIRSRGYFIKVNEDGSTSHIRITPAEREWLGIKIEDLKLEISKLRTEIATLSKVFKAKAKATKKIAKESNAKFRADEKAKAEAKKLEKNDKNDEVSDVQNAGQIEIANASNELMPTQKDAEAFSSLESFLAEGLEPDIKALPRQNVTINEKMLGITQEGVLTK